MDYNTNIGDAIKHFRKEQGLTQMDLCSKTGYSQTYLSQVERGNKTPTIAFINNICKHLKVYPVLLFWHSIKEKDIKPSKRENFKILKPSIDIMFLEIFK